MAFCTHFRCVDTESCLLACKQRIQFSCATNNLTIIFCSLFSHSPIFLYHSNMLVTFSSRALHGYIYIHDIKNIAKSSQHQILIHQIQYLKTTFKHFYILMWTTTCSIMIENVQIIGYCSVTLSDIRLH